MASSLGSNPPALQAGGEGSRQGTAGLLGVGTGRLTKPRRELARKQYGSAEDRSRDEAVNASEELFSQRYDDARRATHVAEAVQVLVLGHFADELGAMGAHASDSVVDAFDCKHHESGIGPAHPVLRDGAR